MTLQFVTGKASVDHQASLLRELARTYQDHPEDQYYYLVPNHIKFESEVQVLSRLAAISGNDEGAYAQSAVQVLSLTRLAWYFMKNEPAYQLPRISQAGMNMLVYQAILDHQDELRLFAGEADRPGFISLLTRQLLELKTGRVTVSDLQQVAEKLTGTSADLDAKLHDLVLIYDSFETAMVNKYVANTDLLNQLSGYLSNVDLSHAHFYFDGFSQTQFSAQEMQLLTTLMQRAAEVKVALILDHGTPTPDTINQQSLFFQPARTYMRLYQTARALSVPVLKDIRATEVKTTSELQQLEDFWQQSATGVASSKTVFLQQPNRIQIVQADNRYAEVARVAATIRQLVAEKGYRYHDFLILTRHLDQYATILAPIMNAQEIPYFSDVQQSMADHPLVELIDAIFEIKRRHFQYADVMRLLKTELLIPKLDDEHFMAIEDFRDALFKTENWVLKMGYQGSKWTQKADWPYAQLRSDDLGTVTTADQTVSDQINGIRRFVRDTLAPFFKRLDQVKNGREAAKLLVTFMTDNGVTDQLLAWRDDAITAGDLVQAGQPEQVWQMFCDLLDEYVNILGDRLFQSEDFLALLQAGFEGADYSQIPSTLDQVTISESGIIQMNNRKITFIIGATDKTMPDTTLPTHLLNDQDRDKLTLPDGEYLNDGGIVTLQGEPYLNYLAFMTPSQRLIFSYPINAGDDTQNQISPYLNRIQKHFNLPIETHTAAPRADQQDLTPYLGAKRATLRHLIQVSNDSRERNVHLSPSWQYVYQVLNHGDIQPLTEKLLGSISYRNEPVQLDAEIVTGLYNTTINSSISKLEEFYRNQYAYFLKYGLKLRERDEFELSPANTGEFFHAAMDLLMKRVNGEHIDLAKLDDQQLNELIGEITSQILNDSNNLQYAILNSSERMQFIKGQLIGVVRQMAATFQKQSRYTPMRARQTEVMFGHMNNENGLPPLTFDLKNNKHIRVRGKIDRIDTLKLPNNEYVGIVDYKSSERTVKFNEIYEGIAMQMMTYLDVVRQNMPLITDEQEAQLAGALYMHLQNPRLKPTDVKSDVSSALLAKERYEGILVADTDLIHALEPELKPSHAAKVFPFALKKDGSTTAKSSIITMEQLDNLLHYTEMKIVDAGNAIFDGQVALNPYKPLSGNSTAMTNSPFTAIMQFDPMLPENNYRLQTAPLGKNNILKQIEAEVKRREIH
ncbi:PD-(D/E)XK nuclease family protein [Secundilactobacillus folii]|uniref:ATP-dependent helicase/deoxyribonuclease subunit B n=1 Tax=Secundilactobacillus folii TaxID=2678357 RepID=A0A7X3C154_9LACO|nr:PD-(D/E)XK nuclease family protein [Secundilactobacillus folii]MTV81375.1 ATP-dependent helicase [Secundilactobacillus folii]